MANPYDAAHGQSIKDPNGFWGKVAEDCHWTKRWDKVLDDSRKPFYRWFTGGELNTCYNALDLHVDKGRGNQAALIYDFEMAEAGGAERLLGDLLGRNRSSGQIFNQMTFRPEKSSQNSIKYFATQPEAVAPVRLAFITTSASAR